ncbi:MAG: hypothetical protein K2H17_01370 [Duncaniella sp.]|uniref:hypothetical protein n=1 Tax=Duncaniella sp. TaxID=2518496 RepID=UPI0023BE8301|nr:hypothetical protein [Duncaniella sp.]MDE5988026.1 hypothetical protein [Duncaniella sp.]
MASYATDEFQQFSKRDTKALVTLKILKHEIIKRKKDNTVAQILTIVIKQTICQAIRPVILQKMITGRIFMTDRTVFCLGGGR